MDDTKKDTKNKNTKFKQISILCIAMLILIYEVGYCNLKTIVIDHSYNLSFVRIAIYGIVIILLAKFGNDAAKKAQKIFPRKKKIIFGFHLIMFKHILKMRRIPLLFLRMANVFHLIFLIMLLIIRLLEV